MFYSELKRHKWFNIVFIVEHRYSTLENDNTVLIKDLKGCNVKFSRNTHLIETSYDRLKSREITFQQYRENLAKAEFSDNINIHEHKRYYYTPFIYSLLFTGEHSTNLSTLNHNVRFLPCQHRGVGIMQYVRAKPCAHVYLFPDTPRREVPRQGCGHS